MKKKRFAENDWSNSAMKAKVHVRQVQIRRSRTLNTRLYAYPERVYRMKWAFHPQDADFRPSVPHGHSVEGNYRLNPWSGEVYLKQAGALIPSGHAKESEMRRLRANAMFKKFASQAIEWYHSNYPQIPLDYIPENFRYFHSSKTNRRSKCEKGFICVLRVRLHIK